MDILYPHCAGLDVHKDSVVARIRHTEGAGPARTKVRTFATVTSALLALLDWLLAEGVSHVAMESTGVCWKPLFNLLEGPLHVILVNAHAVKQVPGRKTDVGDAACLAQLLQHGLLTAEVIVAEIGVDMTPFATAAKLASWAGLCPGNDQNAGKRRSRRVPFGNRWLRQALVQAAWPASRCHGSYLSAHYRQLARRRGRKRAAVAVAHTLLVISYHLLKRDRCYQDLGPMYLERLAPERLTSQLVRRLERLGIKSPWNQRQLPEKRIFRGASLTTRSLDLRQ